MGGGPEQQERGAKATAEADVGGRLEKEPAANGGAVVAAGSAVPAPSAVTSVAAATPADGVAMMTTTQKLAAIPAKRAIVERLRAKLNANDDNQSAVSCVNPINGQSRTGVAAFRSSFFLRRSRGVL